MARRKRVLVDVDEVLGDFQTPVLKIVENLFGRKMVPEDFDTWDIFGVFPKEERDAIFEVIKRPGFCSDFQAKEGAIEAVRELRLIADVYPVTSPFPSPTWVWDRTLWLAEVFDFKPSEVISTAAKHTVGGNVLVDDKPQHVLDWMEEHPNGVGLLWHIPNTRMLTQYDHLRVKNWTQVVEKVKAL